MKNKFEVDREANGIATCKYYWASYFMGEEEGYGEPEVIWLKSCGTVLTIGTLRTHIDEWKVLSPIVLEED